ncbi:hypothetical protein CRUP_000489 [Coryphaenoides rupestris]|nr:hypothetical protein CRUP_000489 [Coryphaenoides rupestris]
MGASETIPSDLSRRSVETVRSFRELRSEWIITQDTPSPPTTHHHPPPPTTTHPQPPENKLLQCGEILWSRTQERSGRPRSPFPAPRDAACLHDDYSLELNMYCSSRNLTQMPANMPTATYSLWLDGNLFPTLPAASFKDLTSLEFLNLQSGQLATLDPQNTPNLASLSLHNNQLSRVEERLFAGLSHMWLLNLGWNSLTVLPETVFHELYGLRELVLAGNRLAYLQTQLFQSLTELKELDLTGNFLKVIKANVFTKLSKLQKLYLAQNQIATVVREPSWE